MCTSRSVRAILFAAVLSAILAATSTAYATPAYRLVDLGYTTDSCAQWSSINNSGQWVTLEQPVAGADVSFVPETINDKGQIAGAMYTTSGDWNAFVWDGSSMQEIGSLGGGYSEVYGLNNLGQVAGRSATASGGYHAFLYSPGVGMIDLTPWSNVSSEAMGINERGQVTGYAKFPCFCLR